MDSKELKIAVVHDWFNQTGGAEKVVKEILQCFPTADVFCLFDFFGDADRNTYLLGKKTKKSFIQHIPFARKRYRNLFPLFPTAVETLDLRGYDVILSSSSCVAKGVKRVKGQLHICYCHSPARYVWDLKDEYLKAVNTPPAKALLRYFFDRLRAWDLRSNDRVDYFIANSQFVANRIKTFFKRDSTVIYPPVNVAMKEPDGPRTDTYITVSRLVTYKNVEMIVEAFRRMPELKLEVAGDGILRRKILRNLPPNVAYLGYIDDETKYRKISRAKAFIAAATEDFGISIVEAQSYGTPVIIPNVGGYKETVNTKTGVFFGDKTVEALVETVKAFHAENRAFRKEDFEEKIKPFCEERFRNEYKTYVNEAINRHFGSV